MAHHLYFNGEPAEVLALGAFFSALEVIPLTFLTVEAWTFLRLGIRQEAEVLDAVPPPVGGDVPRRRRVLELPGGGVFGFLINLPIVSYYEIGTGLTANHSHAAMMGVYGMLAVGFMLFCLRYLMPEDKWSDKLAKISFWSLNIGLAWMTFVTLLPLGIMQLHRSVGQGYWAAREHGVPHQRPQLAPRVAPAAGRRRCSSAAACSPCCGWGSRASATAAATRRPSTDEDLLLFTEVVPLAPPPTRPRAGRRPTDVVDPEAAFLAGYALVLVAVAAGLGARTSLRRPVGVEDARRQPAARRRRRGRQLGRLAPLRGARVPPRA